MRGLLIASALTCLATPALGQAASEPTPMRCEMGGIKRDFGGSTWIVYGCADGASLIFVSDTGSPAMPFFFILTPKDGAYLLTGEGNGDRTYTQAAYDDLKRLGEPEIEALLAETSAAGPAQQN